MVPPPPLPLPSPQSMRRRRAFLFLPPLLLSQFGCVYSNGLAAASVVSPSGRTAWLGGLAIRSDLRLPRNYQDYVGTEVLVAGQAFVGNPPPDPHAAGKGQPAERFGINAGVLRAPEASERWGLRAGPRLGVWYGALGDRSSRVAIDLGAEISPILRLGPRLPPWEADETVSMNFVLIPTLFVDPVVARIGPAEESHYAFSYGLMLSVGVSVSSTLVP